MDLKQYLKENKVRCKDFARFLGISRVTLYLYLRNERKVPMPVKIAIEFLTGGKVRRNEWKN